MNKNTIKKIIVFALMSIASVGKQTGDTYLLDAGGSLGFGFYLFKDGVRVETWAKTKRTEYKWERSTSGNDWLNAFQYKG